MYSGNIWTFKYFRSNTLAKDVINQLDLIVEKVQRQDSLFMKKVRIRQNCLICWYSVKYVIYKTV